MVSRNAFRRKLVSRFPRRALDMIKRMNSELYYLV